MNFLKESLILFLALLALWFYHLSYFGLLLGYIWKSRENQSFFSQYRVGKNKQLFKMYKFRSMCVDAEKKLPTLLSKNEVEGAMFKMKDDPRVTKFGRFIRKTSLDELPQLWNVLKGEMSLVGPRPSLQREVSQYTKYDEQRLLVKPGCTGLWQINGRSNIGFSEMVMLDLEYIEKRSIYIDFKIIYRTFFVILRPEGAC